MSKISAGVIVCSISPADEEAITLARGFIAKHNLNQDQVKIARNDLSVNVITKQEIVL